MSRHLPDTSCLIAAVCAWRERHESTRKEIERRRLAGATPVLAAYALTEA